ncbi:Uncharacterised protein [Escherichia coli]|nr:Uncharacterised protein [Escherichia coli]
MGISDITHHYNEEQTDKYIDQVSGIFCYAE